MKRFSSNFYHSLWLTGFIWTLIFAIVELLRPGLISTRILLLPVWLILLVGLIWLPEQDKKNIWPTFLVAFLASAIISLLATDIIFAVFCAVVVFALLMLVNNNE